VQPGSNSVVYNEEYYGTAMFNKFLSYPAYVNVQTSDIFGDICLERLWKC